MSRTAHWTGENWAKHSRDLKREDMRVSIRMMKQAIKLDPENKSYWQELIHLIKENKAKAN